MVSWGSRVAEAGVEVPTGRKWSEREGLEVAESRLTQKALVGTLETGQAGLGAIQKPRSKTDTTWSKTRTEQVLSRMVSM